MCYIEYSSDLYYYSTKFNGIPFEMKMDKSCERKTLLLCF